MVFELLLNQIIGYAIQVIGDLSFDLCGTSCILRGSS